MADRKIVETVTTYERVVSYEELLKAIGIRESVGTQIMVRTPSGPSWASSTYNLAPISELVVTRKETARQITSLDNQGEQSK